MTNVNETINNLLDHQMIQAAKAAHAAAGERRAMAAAEVAAANDAHKQATKASDVAAMSGDVVVTTAAEGNLENAERRKRVAAKLAGAADDAHRASADALTLATRHAHLPVLLAGVRGRIAAAVKADHAVAMLKEAQDEMRLADRLIAAAYASAGAPNAPDPVGTDLLVAGLPRFTEASERNLWKDRGFDDAAGTYRGFQA